MIIEAIPQWDPEIHARVTVKDGPVVPMAHSRAGGRYRVDTITIEYRWTDEDGWCAWSVALSGPRVKKDGTDAGTRYRATVGIHVLNEMLRGDAVLVERWAWLLPVIESLSPAGHAPARPSPGDANVREGSGI